MNTQERKPCVRCTRQIDAAAKSCLYCNWDQAATPPAKPAAQQSATPVYTPPPDNRARNKILGIIGFAALLVIAFVVGSFVHGFESKDVKAAQPKAVSEAPPAAPQPQANVTLVPVQEQQPSGDGTALLTEQLGAQQPAQQPAIQPAQGGQSVPMLDPRMVTTPAPGGSSLPPAPLPPQQPQQRTATVARPRPHTEPVPQYQPVPSIRVDRETTARLSLTVGADGRVKDIDIIDSVAGETPRLINAVQNWRFKPATISGQPVPSRFTVNITFHAS